MAFKVLNIRNPEDRSKIIALRSAWHLDEPFSHPGYVVLFTRPEDICLCAIWWVSENDGIMFPFILRELVQNPWAKEYKGWFDLTSPYGYGGAYCTEGAKVASEKFWCNFENWLDSHCVVSSIIRLHLFSNDLAPYNGAVEERAPNVVRSLNINEELLWYDYKHKVRKNVKRALNSGLRIEIDKTGKRIEQFYSIYSATMERRSANDWYKFDRVFFEKLIGELKHQALYFHAILNGKIVSSELVLASKYYLYSFLGGTLREFFDLRPNDLLKHEIIRYGIGRRMEGYILGGGYGEEDGIYHYKLSFAPKGTIPFYLGKKIHNEKVYRQLVQARKKWSVENKLSWKPEKGFFPEYRG